jgi:hypothetical protein
VYITTTDEISVSKIIADVKNTEFTAGSGAAAPQNALRFQVEWLHIKPYNI